MEKKTLCIRAAIALLLIMLMAIVECGTANQDYLSMLKGFSLAMNQ
jgi:hypothetical protein